MKRHDARWAALLGASATLAMVAGLQPDHAAALSGPQNATCPTGGTSLTLPPGFCATIFAKNIGHARQLAVAPDGTVFVNTWSGRYFHDDAPQSGGFGIALKDTKGTGVADEIQRFGLTPAAGGHGGTGIAVHGGRVYLEESDRIDAYALDDSGVPKGRSETIVSGLPLGGDHPMHPFVISPKGDLFVDMGSATNSCQTANRHPRSPGIDPCRELETRGGTWRFDADKTGETFGPAARYATGIRNGEGFAFDSLGRLFVTQHGRDQLWENWPTLYSQDQGANLPAEEVVELKKGADYGWPECYFDPLRGKLVLAPEYGGDGGQKIGVCADKTPPVAAFPAHWAPNALAIETGSAMFPPAYKDALFVAFHGSWNRAPSPQGGYNIVVQPMKDGKANGPWVVFADGFAGTKQPGAAKHRPTGLAFAPDGALFVSDDVGGVIYRITYQGPKDAAVAAAAGDDTVPGSSADRER